MIRQFSNISPVYDNQDLMNQTQELSEVLSVNNFLSQTDHHLK